MKRSTRKAALFAAALAVVVGVDLMKVAKPSPVAAALCTGHLFKEKEAPSGFLARHQEDIRRAAAAYDLPATLVGAVVADHLDEQTPFRDYTDCAGSALGANLSLGPGQLRLSTAAGLQGKTYAKLTGAEFQHLRAQLLAPDTNIDLTAKELRALLQRAHRYPGISATELLRQPQAMALAVSEYRMGRSSAPREIAKLGINAFGALALMLDGELDYLEQGPARGIGKGPIAEYLRYIHCDSGIFSVLACNEWVARHNSRSSAAPLKKQPKRAST